MAKGDHNMDSNFVKRRITDLRMQKGISEYKMSLDLGHSKSYIQSISSGRALPSMLEFFCICDYLGITPKAFFDLDEAHPVLTGELIRATFNLKAEDIKVLILVAERLNANSKDGSK